MTSLAAMQHLSAIEGTANMPPRTWEPIFDGAVGAARRVGKCVPDRRGVGIPGQGGHRFAGGGWLRVGACHQPALRPPGRALVGRSWRPGPTTGNGRGGARNRMLARLPKPAPVSNRKVLPSIGAFSPTMSAPTAEGNRAGRRCVFTGDRPNQGKGPKSSWQGRLAAILPIR
jgi:hypothetical protein